MKIVIKCDFDLSSNPFESKNVYDECVYEQDVLFDQDAL